MASSRAASQVHDAEADYRQIIEWYEDSLQRAKPPIDLVWEPVKIGPTWKYTTENGWVLPAITLGWRNLAWAGTWLRGKDGGPWTYTMEQARFLLWYWALDEDGEFLYHSGVLQRMKGWGKDPTAACISATALCSDDVTFSHWDNEIPIGRCEPDAWVQVIAVSQQQTQNTMKLFPSLITPEARDQYGIQIGKLNVWAMNDTRQIQAVTSNPLTIEGGRPTQIIRNETQNWNSSNGGHDMAGALEGNTAKSADGAARILDICNAFRPGEDSVGQKAREAYDSTQGIRCEDHEGRLDWPECIRCERPKSIAFGLLYDSLEAPPEAPLTVDDAPAVIEAVRGDATWLNIKRILASILNPMNSPSESRRKWFNQVTAAEDAWADPKDVALAARPERLEPGDTVVLFGDGSKSDDATGLVAVRVSDGHAQMLHVQQPKRGQIVDRDSTDHAVIEAMDTFKVVAFFFDPSHAKDDNADGDNRFWWPMCDEWSQRYGKRLKIWPVKSGNRQHAVAFDMALEINQRPFVSACEQVLTELESGDVTYAESSWMREHLVNCKRAPGKYGVSVRKNNRESRHKIDLAVCLIGGRMLRRIYLLSTNKGTPGKGRVIVMN